MQKIRLNPVNSETLSQGLMLTGIELLSLAVYDLPDIEMRLLKAKEHMLFYQECNHPKVKETINKAYQNLVTQIAEYKKTQNPQPKEQING